VQVLQHDQDRAVVTELDDQVGQVLDEQAALPVPVAPGGGQVPQPGRQQLAEIAPPGVARLPQVAGQLQQQPAGGLGVAGERRRPDHAEPSPHGGVGDGGEQPGLADPGLAGHEQQLAPAARDLAETPFGQGEQVVPADQHRRLERAMTVIPPLQIGHVTDAAQIASRDAGNPSDSPKGV
jgi:hypothetical protein